ncbi:hypothetical protein Ga0466249_002169 [Sporomusaceae bacterium BoRhaA]|uniref:carboxypeptidase-like regulatory domain-containing protein n=1 Tax=Pelorhabdus rhamnosifermentans TaxID=2772457 RepID=UPI001C05FDAA|nr:carboxypeptidase-like regulatory domain-containing protein [Pelorhabdus rhamnosifermentans]MBU2701058.1 hypothetical protein [Pelorhabdus rhamnosifermentans]
MKNAKILLSAILCSIILTSLFYLNTVYASSNCSISGKITDSNLKPIQGAKIIFELDGALNSMQSITTNYRGNYIVNAPLKNKTYWVTIGKKGYKTYRGKVHLTNEDSFVFDVILNK